MGVSLLKATPEQEIYVLWSSISDGPTYAWTSRDEVLRLLKEAEPRNLNPFVTSIFGRIDGADDIMQRLDETGCATRHQALAFGRETTLRCMAGTPLEPADVYWYIARDKIGEYALALLFGDFSTAHSLLSFEPYDDDL